MCQTTQTLAYAIWLFQPNATTTIVWFSLPNSVKEYPLKQRFTSIEGEVICASTVKGVTLALT
jgi:hypothetical protein